VKPRSGQRLIQGGPIGDLAALYLGELVDDHPIAAIQVGFYGLTLGL
jgi:hypothetical protein